MLSWRSKNVHFGHLTSNRKFTENILDRKMMASTKLFSCYFSTDFLKKEIISTINDKSSQHVHRDNIAEYEGSCMEVAVDDLGR